MTRKELMTKKRRHTRVCKLCGNQHPLTGEYFMRVDKANKPGIINGGLLFVCKSCQAHWGPTLAEDVNHMAELIKKFGRLAGKKARSFIDVYGEKGADSD